MDVLTIETEEEAWEIVRRLITTVEEGPPLEAIRLGKWADLRVEVKSAEGPIIKANYMEAFLKLQREIYQTTAMSLHGDPDARRLTDDEIQFYSIEVLVTKGSSKYNADLKKLLPVIAMKLIDKMDAKHVAIVIISLGLLYAGSVSFGSYLETKKIERLAEISSEERRLVISEMARINQTQAENHKLLIQYLGKTEIGKQVVDSSEHVHAGMLKAASRAERSIVQGHEITGDEAKELRKGQRRRAVSKIVIQEMRVSDVNTDDSAKMGIIFTDPESGEKIKAHIRDAMLQETNRDAVFEALKQRGNVWVRLKTKEVEGEIISVDVLSVSAEPPEEAMMIIEEPNNPDKPLQITTDR